MSRYIIKRLLWIIPVLFAVSVITFTLMHAVPGGPWEREKPVSAAIQAALNVKYGLDDPVPIQYVRWVGNLLQGNLGPSYAFVDRTVNDIVGEGLLEQPGGSEAQAPVLARHDQRGEPKHFRQHRT